jgi:hypothetical protein
MGRIQPSNTALSGQEQPVINIVDSGRSNG